MLPPLCTWILPSNQPCRAIALRGRDFCRAHIHLARIEQSRLDDRRLLDRIASLNVQGIIRLLQDTIVDIALHRLSPDRCQLTLHAADERLAQLLAPNLTPTLAHIRSEPRPAPRNPSAGPAPLHQPCLPAGPSVRFSSDPSRPPLRMEDVFGPHAAGVPIPPGLDLNEFVAALEDLQRLYPSEALLAKSVQEIPASPGPSGNYALTHAK